MKRLRRRAHEFTGRVFLAGGAAADKEPGDEEAKSGHGNTNHCYHWHGEAGGQQRQREQRADHQRPVTGSPRDPRRENASDGPADAFHCGQYAKP